MITPEEFSSELKRFGISRESRVLTDWRQKGLLPPLVKRGLGRGLGSVYVWNQEVLEQGIAADWLINRTGRLDSTLLGLWMSGFDVNPEKACEAWLTTLELQTKRRNKSAERFKDGVFGLVTSWIRNARKKQKIEKDMDTALDDIRDIMEWSYEEGDQSDEDIKNLIVEAIHKLANDDIITPGQEIIEIINYLWDKLEIGKIFNTDDSRELIQFVKNNELYGINQKLEKIRKAIQHFLILQNPEISIETQIISSVGLLNGFIGPIFSKLAISLLRNNIEIPLYFTVDALHEFTMSVQLEDITERDDYYLRFSERVSEEWVERKQIIAKTWSNSLETIR
ncbi:MAG: hypothetical protein B6D76_03810 [gamma proteobacterium symbiont of Stewartia floridana]|nr:MAG: hypothetical protein B6D76_03810 [gamma proteobacterium symbiont of Stewartia floridana]RLW60809.1 MAG: hypothetical protein B6D75_04890 [gamma proteobacterium symbiont of Stewartia floridana]